MRRNDIMCVCEPEWKYPERKELEKYNCNTDYCGAGWTTAVVPCRIRGISINKACFVHDRHYYDKDIPRKKVDVKFRKQMYKLLRSGGMWWPGALFYSRIYYRAVRVGGKLYDW